MDSESEENAIQNETKDVVTGLLTGFQLPDQIKSTISKDSDVQLPVGD